ncbi:MAG: hypothetical protein P8M73_03215 [Luminiphilus sp.]|nr:hypothetical protein [Luminiphilus sp.]
MALTALQSRFTLEALAGGARRHPVHCIKLALLAALVFPQHSFAEALHPYLSDRHHITVGGFRQHSDASFTANREGFEPTSVGLSSIGLDGRDSTLMIEYHFRKDERWQYSAGLYRYRQTGDLSAETAFNFDGVEVEVGSSLETDLAIDTYMFDAMYTLRRTDHSELSIGGGLHVLDNDVIVNSRRSVNGMETAEWERGRAALIAPLPNFRATYFHALSPRASIKLTAGWLSLTYDNYDGDFRYIHFMGQYRVTEAIGLMLGYQFAGIDIQENKDPGYNRFDVDFSGLTFGMTYSF